MKTRAEILERFEAEFDTFERLVSGLSDHDWMRPAVDEWSARDITAHFAGYHRAMATALERLGSGLDPRDPDVEEMSDDDWNARFAAAGRLMSRSQLLVDLATAFRTCMAAAESLPAERFETGKAAARWIGEEIDHYRGHTRALLQGLAGGPKADESPGRP